MLHLIVKGNRHQAAKAASDRDIPFVFQRETRHGETCGLVSDHLEERVRAWYHETTAQQFPDGRPVGDLLLWSRL